MKYSEKLKDPRWQRRRLEILNRDDFSCRACGDKKKTLNVHHKQYHGDPWEAPDDSLETLCELCHERRGKINKAFLALDTQDALDLMGEEGGTVQMIIAESRKLRVKLQVNGRNGHITATAPASPNMTQEQFMEWLNIHKVEVASELFRRGMVVM